MSVKTLVDVDVLEVLLNGFGVDSPFDCEIVIDAEPELRRQIADARKAR